MTTHLDATLRSRCLVGRLLAAFLTLCLAGMLQACGPGTGGTGTGSGPMPSGGTAADRIQWYEGTWSASNVVTAGASTWAKCATALTALCAPSDVVPVFEASRIQVTASCWSFTYQGEWSVAPTGELQVSGTYTEQAQPGIATQQSALLLASPAGADLLLSVQDAQGGILQGPLTVVRSTLGLTAAPKACAGP
ncbi:MAG: hypothetical protein WCH44_15030 [Betaproteobacteria bacterium]